MSHNATYEVKFRRRREGKTDYKKRLALLKGNKPRLVVRKSSKKITAQLIEYKKEGDKVLAHSTSNDLKKFGWKLNTKNLPAAYLTGFLCVSKAKETKEAVLDIGRNTPVHGSLIFAALKGAVDAKLNIPFDKKALPKEEKINGKEIEKYLTSIDEEKFKKQFAEYAKKGLDKTKVSNHFQEVLNEIKKKYGER
ncbi:MAG: 50S ribosomal protein L18 [Candidatus Diapherotrites archaeon CG10_big_fil_rev_8_21_14_0_10_31_34]|nr:MAG: 50S ribosomal protein L18 [Candidatus Diapherotrites archaeon CG10_big_fil_rev_8_21_14_0_10_31_34]